ncbi:MAG: general secretion pathway protein GspK [Desulfuromonas sp.]|nr:general secretion pathway protein GspK [Desulfuromonas sp.]
MPRRERGMVLLLVLLVVVLLTTLLTEFAFSTLVDLRLAETFRDSTRAYYLAKGGVNAGSMLLKRDRNNHDSLDEFWHQGVNDYPVGDGTVTIHIEDLGGKLAVNALVSGNNPDTVMVDRFYRFFTALELPAPADPAELTAALIDWLDSGDDTYREILVDGRSLPVAGAESAYYQGLATPYRSKNGPLHTLEELVNIKGFTPEVVQRIAPYLAVNGDEKININTAGIEVLMALSPQLDRGLAQKIVDYRATTPLDTLDQLTGILPDDQLSALKSQANLGQLGTTSDMYRIESQASFNDGRRRIAAEVDKQTSRILFLKVD